jgi:carboxylate-amine ligase
VEIRSVGVEEELLLVDSGKHRAAPVAEDVVARAGGDDPDGESPVEHELKQEQVEVGSAPTTSMADLREDLVRLRGAAARAAADQSSTIVAIATSPFPGSPSMTPTPRYERITREYGLLARQQLTCGQHVHVGVQSRAEGVGVLDRVRGWLPVLTAISANSPYWQGEDTGYQSFRSILWGRWPTAGPTEIFGTEARYDAAVAELVESGTTLDDGMIYFDARLSARYPTVEIRVADVCTDVRDAVLLAALARALVDTAAVRWQAGEPAAPIGTTLLRAASWRAARSGLSGELVDPRTGKPVAAWHLVHELVELLGPALRRCGDEHLVTAGLDRLRTQGTGADRQRGSYAVRASLPDLVADAAARTLEG